MSNSPLADVALRYAELPLALHAEELDATIERAKKICATHTPAMEKAEEVVRLVDRVKTATDQQERMRLVASMCDTLDQVTRLEERPDWVSALGTCRGSQGKTATTKKHYERARQLAEAARDTETLAQVGDALAKLEPRLSWLHLKGVNWALKVDVTIRNVSTQEVSNVTLESKNVNVLVDPGKYTIVAKNGPRQVSFDVEINGDDRIREIQLPASIDSSDTSEIPVPASGTDGCACGGPGVRIVSSARPWGAMLALALMPRRRQPR